MKNWKKGWLCPETQFVINYAVVDFFLVMDFGRSFKKTVQRKKNSLKKV